MKKSTLISAFFGFYLGATVSGLYGSSITDIRWWIVVIPSILISTWEKNTYKKEINN